MVRKWVDVTSPITRKKPNWWPFCSPIIQITRTPEANSIGVFCNSKPANRLGWCKSLGKRTRGNPMRSQTNRVESGQARRGRHSASSASISQNRLGSLRVLEIYGLHMAQAERPAGCSQPDAAAKRKGRDGRVTLS